MKIKKKTYIPERRNGANDENVRKLCHPRQDNSLINDCKISVGRAGIVPKNHYSLGKVDHDRDIIAPNQKPPVDVQLPNLYYDRKISLGFNLTCLSTAAEFRNDSKQFFFFFVFSYPSVFQARFYVQIVRTSEIPKRRYIFVLLSVCLS